ncbi:hypothetical protein F5Y07DRAFT_400624 [Xylaria sp. FL0933]|nr:hypothetical protein F5Y07DRAFT_400624 [Xylaria sp. FL0933]
MNVFKFGVRGAPYCPTDYVKDVNIPRFLLSALILMSSCNILEILFLNQSWDRLVGIVQSMSQPRFQDIGTDIKASIWHHIHAQLHEILLDDMVFQQRGPGETTAKEQDFPLWTEQALETLPNNRPIAGYVDRTVSRPPGSVQSIYRRMLRNAKVQLIRLQGIASKLFTLIFYDLQLFCSNIFTSALKCKRGTSAGHDEATLQAQSHFKRVNDDAISLVDGPVRQSPLSATSVVEESVSTGTCHDHPVTSYIKDHWHRDLSSLNEDRALRSDFDQLGPNLQAISSSRAIVPIFLVSVIYSDGVARKSKTVVLVSAVEPVSEFSRWCIWGLQGIYTWNHAVPRLGHGREASEEPVSSCRCIGEAHEEKEGEEEEEDDDDDCVCPTGPCPPGQGCRSSTK